MGIGVLLTAIPLRAELSQSLSVGPDKATISLQKDGDARTYELTTNVNLRDNKEKRITVSETSAHPGIRTGNLLFDGLYAMAVSEAVQNSVPQINDGAYGNDAPVSIEAYQTGEYWKYVWTRDLAYSLRLSLAGFDPKRAVNSLLFKASVTKPSVKGGLANQIIQDTGSGGSYPVSTDRVVWTMGADETLKYLSGNERRDFLEKVYPILCDSIEQDRRLIFDPQDGLYRGEQSFLDWREQTYPGWTKENVLAIAMSKSLSVNALEYFLLQRAAEYSLVLKQHERAARYTKWAAELKTAINTHLYDPQSGLYRTYLLSDDGACAIPVSRFDLLGESLAIVCGVADPDRASAVIRNYPTGPHGPPVVWPQEKSVPVYHNQGIWPFVTAYWIKAAQKAGNTSAVNAGIQSLMQLAALNLSNMENYDFVTGKSHVDDGPRKGPVINSRRQLWSVAGYLSMVQDVVFGLETSWDGIRFAPFITAKLRNETFQSAKAIELRNFPYRGTRNFVRVHLPTEGSFTAGVCTVDRVELNGKTVAGDFVAASALKPTNDWEIFLAAPSAGKDSPPVRNVNVASERAIFGPSQPEWKGEGITLDHGRVELNYSHDDAANVSFNIYCDGKLRDQNVRQTKWMEDVGGDSPSQVVHCYAVQAVDLKSGNVSHPTPGRAWRGEDQQQIIPATALKNRGGNLAGDHFENWGRPGDECVTKNFEVKNPGRYLVRVEFSNGAGPVNTGVTCAVKKLDIRNSSGATVASGYVVMPQSGDWNRRDLSSVVNADFKRGDHYTIRISEDEFSRNMSYLKNNERYTAGNGGGAASYNYVNIASVRLLYAAAAPK
ncbi:MAG: MGH1-like glycoside hydrolase domain-containing protein [Chthoniobacterales bacterium]